MPPDQNESQMRSTLLLKSPVITDANSSQARRLRSSMSTVGGRRDRLLPTARGTPGILDAALMGHSEDSLGRARVTAKRATFPARRHQQPLATKRLHQSTSMPMRRG